MSSSSRSSNNPESEEDFVTHIFEDLVLPRGPVFSVKVQTFKSDPDVEDEKCDSMTSSIRIDPCKSVQIKGPVSSLKVQKFNNVVEDPNKNVEESEYVNLGMNS